MNRPSAHPAFAQAGFSLVELMVAITLGLLILAALIGVFAANSRSFHQNDATEQLQDNARTALDALGRDLSMAGYYGGMSAASTITVLPAAAVPNNDCGSVGSAAPVSGVPWFLQLGKRVEFFDGTTMTAGPAGATVFKCLDPAALQPGSDIVAIRRVAGQSDYDTTSNNPGAPRLHNGYLYLQTNGTTGSMAQAIGSGTPGTVSTANMTPAIPLSYYRYVPRVYYVRQFTRTDPTTGAQLDHDPALCRAEYCPAGWVQGPTGTIDTATCNGTSLSSAGFYAQCIATGVESLQVEWGLALSQTPANLTVTPGAANCVADTYTSTPLSDPNPNNDVLAAFGLTAQISVLLRTTQADGLYTDTKSFNIADYSQAAMGDRFHRRVFSTLVQLRNPNGDSGLCTN